VTGASNVSKTRPIPTHTGDGGENRPEETVASGRDVGDDDVLQEEKTGDADNVDRVSGRVGVDRLGRRNDNVADHIEEDAERVGLDTAGAVGNLGDRWLRHGLEDRFDRRDGGQGGVGVERNRSGRRQVGRVGVLVCKWEGPRT
jgi:hypothetical protein